MKLHSSCTKLLFHYKIGAHLNVIVWVFSHLIRALCLIRFTVKDQVSQSGQYPRKTLDVSRRTAEKLNRQLVAVTDLDIEL